MNFYTIGAMVVYLIAMLAIGFYFTEKNGDLSNYFLGGRKMNKWVVAFSAQASDMSGWLLMGLPGAVMISGLSASWIGIGLLIGTYLNWLIIARRLRISSHVHGDAITIPDYISNRFHDQSGVARGVAALIILAFFLFYTASGFVSCAKLFTEIFGFDYQVALWAGALIVVSYTLLGGYMAVCWTDFIQGSVMILALVLVPAIVIYQAGGFGESVAELNAFNPALLGLMKDATTGQTISLIALLSSLVWGLGYFGMPHILVRFMSIQDAAEVKGSRRIAMSWVVISLIAAVLIGLAGHLYLRKNGLSLADVGGDPEKIFMVMINGIFSCGVLSKIFAGVLMSAILAAIMSTADSQLLVSASAFSNDIYKRLIHKNATPKELVFVSRLSVALVALIAAVMASGKDSEFFKVVMKMVSFAWGGFGAAFGPLVLLALFWRRMTLAGAAAGMIVGAVTCFVWKFYLQPTFPDVALFALYELAPGFVLSLVTIVVVSLLTPPPPKAVTDEFDTFLARTRS